VMVAQEQVHGQA